MTDQSERRLVIQPAPETTIQVSRQRFKLRAWIRTRLWAQVIAGMLLGFGVGLLLNAETGWVDPAQAELIGLWLALPGQIFLALIAMVLVPLIFSSIVGGLNGAGSGAELRAVGLRLAAFILGTTCIAAAIGMVLAKWLQPGAALRMLGVGGPAAVPGQTGETPDAAPPEVVGPDIDGSNLPAAGTLNGNSPAAADAGAATDGAEAAPVAFQKLPELIADILPSNPTASIAQGDMLAVVVLALLVGLSVTQVQRERAAPFLGLIDALLSISMNIVKWAMFLAPFAVFGLMAQLVTRIGFETLIGISGYVGTVLLGLAVLLALYAVIAWVFASIGPVAFMRTAGGNLLLAFSTSSSSAVMPETIQTARRLGVPENIANLVIPLGATMNMAGTALYQAVAILFLAQLAGIELSVSQTLIVTGTLVASSIGAPGTPGVSIAILVSVATSMNIPVEGMVIILGVDRLLDMSRTVVNVTGDLIAAVLLRDTAVASGEVRLMPMAANADTLPRRHCGAAPALSRARRDQPSRVNLPPLCGTGAMSRGRAPV